MFKRPTYCALLGMAFMFLAELAFNAGRGGAVGLQTVVSSIAGGIPVLVLATQAAFIAGLAAYLFLRRNKLVHQALAELSSSGVELAFLVALAAMAGSLFYSEVMHYVPCVLCWYQRIFMYPITFLLAVALWKKRDDALDYVLPLAVIGSIFSIYHYNEQFLGLFSNCASTCGQRTVAAYGYLTIPLMALTASVVISCLLFLNRHSKNAV